MKEKRSVKAPLFVVLVRAKNSADRNRVRTACGMIPLEEITPVHAVELFRSSKVRVGRSWNDSVLRNCFGASVKVFALSENVLGGS